MPLLFFLVSVSIQHSVSPLTAWVVTNNGWLDNWRLGKQTAYWGP